MFLTFCNIIFFTADTPFGNVKLKDLGAWLGRRNRSPSAILGACSRGMISINKTIVGIMLVLK